MDRVVAIDWSGDKTGAGQRKHIWAAKIDGSGIDLIGSRTREEVCADLIARFRGTRTAIGLDFAFGFPASFFRNRHYASVGELWQAAAECGEEWLQACRPPFWGRAGRKCPPSHAEDGFRRTDVSIAVGGIRPKSPLQIGGAGAVGTGSIRGMPMLAKLREAGFSIWPFDPVSLPLVMEIYPRLLTGPVQKSSAEARGAYLDRARFMHVPGPLRRRALGSEDAFDALISAVLMWERRAEFARLAQASDPVELLEGRIWVPEGWREAVAR